MKQYTLHSQIQNFKQNIFWSGGRAIIQHWQCIIWPYGYCTRVNIMVIGTEVIFLFFLFVGSGSRIVHLTRAVRLLCTVKGTPTSHLYCMSSGCSWPGMQIVLIWSMSTGAYGIVEEMSDASCPGVTGLKCDMRNEGVSLLWHGKSILYVTSVMPQRTLYGPVYLSLSFLQSWGFLSSLVENYTWLVGWNCGVSSQCCSVNTVFFWATYCKHLCGFCLNHIVGESVGFTFQRNSGSW